MLDGFVDTVGELLLATARIREVGRTLPPALRPPLDEGVDRLHAIVKELHGQLMGVRMTPLAVVTERLPRMARDVARKLGRQVEVEVEGAEIELDRAILEELSDPLLHVLRNAVDHGIEPPHLRLLAGKPATGRITIVARRDRDRVVLEIADDGKGMNTGRLREAAVRRGALTPEQAAALSEREALALATLPGVSTADQVTDVSGRGVGLDAVRKTLETVGGTLELESTRGLGTRVTLRLPLTVAVQPVLLVQVGEEVLGLPITKVHGAAHVRFAALDRSRGAPVLAYDGELVPVHDLAALLGFGSAGPRRAGRGGGRRGGRAHRAGRRRPAGPARGGPQAARAAAAVGERPLRRHRARHRAAGLHPRRHPAAGRMSLPPRHVDALQELTSIGCGAALTALARLTRLRLDMDVPECWIGTSAGAIADFLGALGGELVAVGVRLEGPLTGHLLLALPVARRRGAGRGAGRAGAGRGPSARWRRAA